MTVASDRPIIGTSKDPDSFLAGEEAAKIAYKQLPSDVHPKWMLVFSGGRHDPEMIHKGIQSVVGNVPIVGGSAVGIITNDKISYTGHECSIAIFCGAGGEPLILTADRLDQGEFEAGKCLGEQLKQNAEDNRSVIVFYDSVRSVPPPVLNVGSLLMDGLSEGLGDKPLNIFGAGLVGDLQYSTSFLFDGEKPCKHTAMAIVLPSTWLGNTTIMHGCTPLSNFLEITRIEGPVIYELEGRPALDVLIERVSPTGEGISEINFPMTIALGAKYGDPYASFDESFYVSRLIMDVNPENGTVTLFEADFKTGQKVQIMSRNNEVVLDSVQQQTQRVLDSLDSDDFRWAFYIDCAGRTSAFCGAETEEASILQRVLGNALPLFGFYSGVELASFLGRTRPLDWSGVLTVFTQKR